MATLAADALAQQPQSPAELQKQARNQLATAGFEIYDLPQKDGPTIHCYLSKGKEELPLIVNVNGSGCSSAFTKTGDRISGGITQWLAMMNRGKAHVLVIEKPGVRLFDSDDDVSKASRTFLEKYTLEYITQSHAKAIRAIQSLPQVSKDRLLVFGISDGGQIVAELSAMMPEVTHVAALAGGGPTQIFDFVHFVAQPQEGDKPGDAQARVAGLYKRWSAIQQAPESIEKFWSGHPYRRWASFAKASSIDALLKTNAKIYVAHGTEDQSVPIVSFDVLVSSLRAKGKTLVAERLDGLSHNFQTEDEKANNQYDNMDQLLKRIFQWWED